MSTSTPVRRREFLTRSATAGAAGLLTLSTAVQAQEEKKQKKRRKRKRNGRRKRRALTVQDLHEDHFEEMVGQKFKVSHLRGSVTLKLVQVHDHDHHSDSARPLHIRQEAFSLLFVAPKGVRLKSGIHEFEHPELGEFDLFLHEVVADDDKSTVHYEVVFN